MSAPSLGPLLSLLQPALLACTDFESVLPMGSTLGSPHTVLPEGKMDVIGGGEVMDYLLPHQPAPARGMACSEVEGGATSDLWGGQRAEGGQGLTRATWKAMGCRGRLRGSPPGHAARGDGRNKASVWKPGALLGLLVKLCVSTRPGYSAWLLGQRVG